ncbi:uncharacterized protein LOC141680699 [Apium graveolens]|uniref:uncharacterized protein LOC141680699 n=1 Tax=Apium graveolens TaxID=4045 RepID=UPI003D7BC261
MANNSNNFSMRSVLEKDKLTGINFLDWQRNLRIVLRQERKLHVIDVPRSGPLPEGKAHQERFDIRKSVYECKHGDHDLVGPHVLKMIGYMDHLVTLGYTIGPKAHIDLILQSLNNYSAQLIINYNMNEIDKTPTDC